MILHLVSHRESHIKEAFSSISITRTKGSLPGILIRISSTVRSGTFDNLVFNIYRASLYATVFVRE